MAPEVADEPLVAEDWLARPAWHRAALCTGETATFFSTAPANLERAKATCQGCPVRQECYDHSMADPDLLGVWAGFTAKERRERRRRVA